MGLSKGQKKRLYGQNTQAQVSTPPPLSAPNTVSRPHITQRVVTDYSPTELAAHPEKGGGSHIFVGVAFTVTMLFLIYYYLILLPGVSRVAGVTAPELMGSFDAGHLQALAAGLGEEGIRSYQIVHRSTGLILPLIFAFSWWNMVRASRFELLLGRLMLTLPIAYAAVFIAGGFVLDQAIANPLSSATALASLLIALRWVLFVLCLLQLGYLAARLVRSKVDAFSRGELPDQS